jgi:hypothetical protein
MASNDTCLLHIFKKEENGLKQPKSNSKCESGTGQGVMRFVSGTLFLILLSLFKKK